MTDNKKLADDKNITEDEKIDDKKLTDSQLAKETVAKLSLNIVKENESRPTIDGKPESLQNDPLETSREATQPSDIPPSYRLSYSVGVTESRNYRYRSTMEDVHTYVANFSERLDWGYFALFDGHAGKACAKWCGQNLHILLEKQLLKNESLAELLKKNELSKISRNDTTIETISKDEIAKDQSNINQKIAAIPPNDQDIICLKKDLRDCLGKAFEEADALIGECNESIKGSGCTAAVAILRWELDDEFETKDNPSTTNNRKPRDPFELSEERFYTEQDYIDAITAAEVNRISPINSDTHQLNKYFDFIPTKHHRRVLYTANAGDSRLVLCRAGHAIRLSYDHKGSDYYELNRIINQGGLMMKNRVNGVLAITRSLGDTYLKSLILGKPYTTAVQINENDEFLIIACDGLWDVISDQEAVDLIRYELDPNEQAKMLVDYALKNMSTDNITCMVVRFDNRIFDMGY